MSLICPHCDGEVDAYVPVPWGDGGYKGEDTVPFVCAWCASLTFMHRRGKEDIVLFTIPDIEKITGLNVKEIIAKNERLSETIEKARLLILRLRNRRPVLR